MSQIPYVSNQSELSAASMNAIWAEFDRKLGLILNGKSFALGFVPANSDQDVSGTDTTTLWKLCGDCFFFLSGTVYYSQMFPRFTPDPAHPGLGLSYDHSKFTTQLASLQTTENNGGSGSGFGSSAYDTLNKIVSIPRIDNTTRTAANVPTNFNVGFFDWCLSVGTILHTEDPAQDPVEYYLLETDASMYHNQPEKHLDWAVAELIVEGPTTWNKVVPVSWNKYRFFRIHNFNRTAITVQFEQESGGYLNVTVSAFGCATVRRQDGVAEIEGNYFWQFRDTDMKSYWHPRVCATGIGAPSQDLATCALFVHNGAYACNVWNPAVLYDWYLAFTLPRPYLSASQVIPQWKQTRRAWFIEDLHASQWDGSSLDPDLWPAITDQTLAGDLIHHRGKVLVCKYHKTLKMMAPANPTPGRAYYWYGLRVLSDVQGKIPLCSFDLFEFKGYATLKQDLAQFGVIVSGWGDQNDPLANGGSGYPQLKLAQDPASQWNIILLPLTTNLLVRRNTNNWPQNPAWVDLSAGAYYLESALFEINGWAGNGNPIYSNSISSYIDVFQRQPTSTTETRIWNDGDAVSGGGSDHTVNGNTTQTLQLTHTGKQQYSHWLYPSIQIWRHTVADLKTLSFWGSTNSDGTLMASQNDASGPTTYDNASLTRGPEGLVLTFREVVASPSPDVAYTGEIANYTGMDMVGFNCIGQWQWSSDGSQRYRWRVVRFRGLGWGYASMGAAYAMFVHPRRGLRMASKYVTGDVKNSNGQDITDPELPNIRSGFKMLRRPRWESVWGGGGVGYFEDGAQFVANEVPEGRLWRLDLSSIWRKQVDSWQRCAAAAESQVAQICQTARIPLIDIKSELLAQAGCPSVDYVSGQAVLDYPVDLAETLVEHYNLAAQTVNNLVQGSPLPLDVMVFRASNQWCRIRQTVYTNVPLPKDFFCQTWGRTLDSLTYDTPTAFEPEGLYTLLGIPIKGSAKNIGIYAKNQSDSTTGLPGWHTARNTVRTWREVHVPYTISFPSDWKTLEVTDQVDTSDPRNPYFINLTVKVNVSVGGPAWGDYTYADNAGDCGWWWAGDPSGATDFNIRNYDELRWVGISGIINYCNSIGWPFKLVETGVPVSLVVMDSSSSTVGQGMFWEDTRTFTFHQAPATDTIQEQTTTWSNSTQGTTNFSAGARLIKSAAFVPSSSADWKIITGAPGLVYDSRGIIPSNHNPLRMAVNPPPPVYVQYTFADNLDGTYSAIVTGRWDGWPYPDNVTVAKWEDPGTQEGTIEFVESDSFKQWCYRCSTNYLVLNWNGASSVVRTEGVAMWEFQSDYYQQTKGRYLVLSTVGELNSNPDSVRNAYEVGDIATPTPQLDGKFYCPQFTTAAPSGSWGAVSDSVKVYSATADTCFKVTVDASQAGVIGF